VSALAYDACCLWCLGYPERAEARSQEALALSRKLDHAFSLADVLCFAGCVFNQLRGNAQELQHYGDELARLSQNMGFRSFWGTGACYRSAALVRLGQVQEGIAQIREGLEFRESLDTGCFATGILGALAEAQGVAGVPEDGLVTISRALSLVEETDERYCEAELHRVEGHLRLALGQKNQAQASFEKAVEVAHRMGAKSWELRAATDLARLWQQRGRQDEAKELLAWICVWFTEGFDTTDLKEAKALLDQL
jgi:predicted ATPase